MCVVGNKLKCGERFQDVFRLTKSNLQLPNSWIITNTFLYNCICIIFRFSAINFLSVLRTRTLDNKSQDRSMINNKLFGDLLKMTKNLQVWLNLFCIRFVKYQSHACIIMFFKKMNYQKKTEFLMHYAMLKRINSIKSQQKGVSEHVSHTNEFQHSPYWNVTIALQRHYALMWWRTY